MTHQLGPLQCKGPRWWWRWWWWRQRWRRCLMVGRIADLVLRELRLRLAAACDSTASWSYRDRSCAKDATCLARVDCGLFHRPSHKPHQSFVGRVCSPSPPRTALCIPPQKRRSTVSLLLPRGIQFFALNASDDPLFHFEKWRSPPFENTDIRVIRDPRFPFGRSTFSFGRSIFLFRICGRSTFSFGICGS